MTRQVERTSQEATCVQSHGVASSSGKNLVRTERHLRGSSSRALGGAVARRRERRDVRVRTLASTASGELSARSRARRMTAVVVPGEPARGGRVPGGAPRHLRHTPRVPLEPARLSHAARKNDMPCRLVPVPRPSRGDGVPVLHRTVHEGIKAGARGVRAGLLDSLRLSRAQTPLSRSQRILTRARAATIADRSLKKALLSCASQVRIVSRVGRDERGKGIDRRLAPIHTIDTNYLRTVATVTLIRTTITTTSLPSATT